MNEFKKLREASGMNMKQFAAHFEIPYRTVQNWEAGVNKCPEYLLKLMEHKLKKVYLIYKDNQDDYCDFIGRFVGTEEEVDRYCDEYNSKCRYEWEEITWLCVADMDDVNLERGGEDAVD